MKNALRTLNNDTRKRDEAESGVFLKPVDIALAPASVVDAELCS